MTATVVVAGPVANKPFNGGGAWSRLTLVRGLLALGIDAYLLEEISAGACTGGDGQPAPFAESVNLEFFRRAVLQLGLERRAALVSRESEETEGLGWDRVVELAETADLLVNVSGHLRLPALKDRFRRKAYLDVDPGFTQFWEAAGNDGGRLEGHDVYFTVGANIGTSSCPIPTGGIEWRVTRPIVVLDDWPVVPGTRETFTTISSWRGPFGPIDVNGHRYGVKAHEFRRFVDLPALTARPFELALDIDAAETSDLTLLRDHGWQLVPPHEVAGDPQAFQSYVQGSYAEFCVAQGVYVHTGSGWFSDRTVRYLASGKPALVQDTGFGRSIPTGAGLIAFATLEEAASGAASIVAEYEAHAQGARGLAERYFSAETVLARLLDEAGIT
ncbi:MAG: hypothetical protein H0W16_03310 [Actinobacteria bacterium]|nr:hypothetical protein [Actinomycetota bacterium]